MADEPRPDGQAARAGPLTGAGGPVPGVTPGRRFVDGVAYAAWLHDGQRRKATAVPYLSHLLAVASLVLEDGGSEDEAIAALLHDALEDQGERTSADEVERRFGPTVARIVLGCSETTGGPRPPWRQRKQASLEHLATAEPDVVRVSLADKLHNARAVVTDYRRLGEGLWSRFNAGRDAQLWYYRSLATVFARRSHSAMADELTRLVAELGDLVEAPEGPRG
ncbi:HD domain-containing protein [soil metagenome]